MNGEARSMGYDSFSWRLIDELRKIAKARSNSPTGVADTPNADSESAHQETSIKNPENEITAEPPAETD